MKSKCIFGFLFISLLSVGSSSSEVRTQCAEAPRVSSCSLALSACKEGLINLLPDEREVVIGLIAIVGACASEAEITKKFGRAPFERPESFAGRVRDTADGRSFASWYTSDEIDSTDGTETAPQFYVRFQNERAVFMGWVAKNAKREARVMLTREH